ncbi:biofilm peroxide resistance protein BsmA [[Pantoea] beijingensis]|uniref:biofilm peroxide resistance protein BsmA n=1 Tax=[Pantoea] beijingensis TaxID=1324864 RepID=UPI000FE33494|nr:MULTISPECIES: biofilm peroxide resistance protein BsmA [Erwiniaceae]
MRTLLISGLMLLLSGCSIMHTTPRPAPAPTQQAQEIVRAQSTSLPRLGNISATERGSPDDVQRVIAARATAMGASYYMIVALSESVAPGMWYASAILYGPSTATGAQ